MKNWPLVLLSALLAALALLHWGPTPESASAQPKEALADGAKWEYKVMAAKDNPAETEKALNQLAAEGWELGSMITKVGGGEPQQPRFAGEQIAPKWSFNTEIQLILKRPKR